jgi:hypothetical protein
MRTGGIGQIKLQILMQKKIQIAFCDIVQKAHLRRHRARSRAMLMSLTEHARIRINQRGIHSADLDTFMHLADIARPVDRGLTVHRISRQALAAARGEGMAATLLERIGSLALIEASDGAIVTCAHIHGRKSQAYRQRDRRKFWRN